MEDGKWREDALKMDEYRDALTDNVLYCGFIGNVFTSRVLCCISGEVLFRISFSFNESW